MSISRSRSRQRSMERRHHQNTTVLASFKEILSKIHVCFFGGEKEYNPLIISRDADSLTFLLATAEKFEKDRMIRLKEGRGAQEDFEQVPNI